MENKNFFHSFDKLETKADVLNSLLSLRQLKANPTMTMHEKCLSSLYRW